MTLDTVVVGAGPAGLATSRELARRGVAHVVLERGDRLGHSWSNLYDSLVLHTGKHLSALPGMGFPTSTPLFPTRRDFLTYLDRYADRFRLPIETGADVTRIERTNGAWTIWTRPSTTPGASPTTTAGTGATLRARAVIVATGIVANPHVPEVQGRSTFRGRVRHSVEYRRPSEIGGPRVLVIGAGNSAGEIAVELWRAGAEVTLSVRSGTFAVPLTVLGIPIQYVSILYGSLPRPVQRGLARLAGRAAATFRGTGTRPPRARTGCARVPLIGFQLTNALRSGAIRLTCGIAAFTAAGVRFADGSEQAFDDVILATGYRASVGMLGNQITVDECGFGRRRDRVVSVDQPDLYFVGHNSDVRGGLFSIARDAQRVGRIMGSQNAAVGATYTGHLSWRS